jgi:hypothetical protein
MLFYLSAEIICVTGFIEDAEIEFTFIIDTVLPGCTGEEDRDLLRNFFGDLDLSDPEEEEEDLEDDLDEELDDDLDLKIEKKTKHDNKNKMQALSPITISNSHPSHTSTFSSAFLCDPPPRTQMRKRMKTSCVIFLLFCLKIN